MKKQFLKLGKFLTKDQQSIILGGNVGSCSAYCGQTSCHSFAFATCEGSACQAQDGAGCQADGDFTSCNDALAYAESECPQNT